MKELRKIYKGLVVTGFILFGLMLSCDDDFLSHVPYGKNIPKDTDDLAMMLNQVTDPFMGYGIGNFFLQSDDILIPENKFSSMNFIDRQLYTWKDYFLSESDHSMSWDSNYKVVSIANYVLEHIDHYPQGDKKFKVNNTKGRALFLRANSYFLLINGYAKNYNTATAVRDLGVPMPLQMDISEQFPRSTVQQVYDLIVKDLNQSIPLLDATPKHPAYWSCKAAAYALLGRMYLYQKNYNQSAENAKLALDLYSALIDYNTITYKDPESKNPAAGIKGFDIDNIVNETETYFSYFNFDAKEDVFCSMSLINAFDKEKDLRYRYFISDRNKKGEDLKGLYIPVNDLTSYKIFSSGISIPEVYLNYAEALMRQSPPKIQEALIWLNKLRKNRYDAATYTPYTSSDSSEVLKEVMLERRRELRFTAWRWFDMKRLGVSCTRTVKGKTYTLKATSNNYVWSIPANVMEMNPLLKQNPRGL